MSETNSNGSNDTKLPPLSGARLVFVEDRDQVRLEVRETKHPLAFKVARSLNERFPERVEAFRQSMRGNEFRLWGVTYNFMRGRDSRCVRLMASEPSGGISLSRHYNFRSDPCPFLREDSTDWTTLLWTIAEHLGEEDELARQIRLFRWTGAYLEMDGNEPSFTRPDRERRHLEDTVDPQKVGEDSPVRDFSLSWLEGKLSEMTLERVFREGD